MSELEQIIMLLENNNIQEALHLIIQCEDKNGINPVLCNLKGMLAFKAEEYSTAIHCFKEGIVLGGEDADLYYNLACCYEITGELCQALEQYKKALAVTDNEMQQMQIQEIIASLNESIEDNIKKGNEHLIIKNIDDKQMPTLTDKIFVMRERMADVFIDRNQPLVSVVVLAYNNLEKYTKTCVECILKYTTNIDYELVLIDNGSNDGTLEYFKSVVHPNKKVVRITKNIGSGYGGYQSFKQATGKYVVFVANDLYVTKNWLSNMLKCMMSDYRIGMVNPVSDYVSNYQSVDLGYTDFDNMQLKAEAYNVSSPSKWEERLRLITLGTLYKRECLDMIGISDYGFIHDFGDDDITFRVRRAGYKAILCKDTFISHAGKITDKGQELMQQSLEKGRVAFREKYHGIDAWDDVNNYEVNMLKLVELESIKRMDHPKVLGIDVKCGTPILEIKNKLQYAHVFDTELSAFSTDAKYWLDLKTICQGDVVVDRIEYIGESFEENSFDYILLGEYLNFYHNPYKLLDSLLKLLKGSGTLLIKLTNTQDIGIFLSILGFEVNREIDSISYLEVNHLNHYLLSRGYKIKHTLAEQHNLNKMTKAFTQNLIRNTEEVKNKEEVINRLIIKEYAIEITANH